jgi:hypothetical protein
MKLSTTTIIKSAPAVVTSGDIEGSSLVKRVSQRRNRLILSVQGLEKEGKTHFGFTTPDPIAYFGFDLGEEGVKEKFEATKEIFDGQYSLPTPYNSSDAAPLWKQFTTDYKVALASPRIKTLLCDTGTEAWEILRIARFGKLTQIPEFKYTEVNTEYKALIKSAYDSEKNLILLHQVKKEYLNEGWSGRYELAGFSKTGFLVQVKVSAFKDPIKKGTDQFQLKVLDCRQNAEANGKIIKNDFWELVKLVYPDAEREKWF